MIFLVKAVRAVVVEMLGVLLVLWVLFGTAIWTTSPKAATAPQTPAVLEAPIAWHVGQPFRHAP